MFHVINSYTRGAQFKVLPAEGSYHLERVGGLILALVRKQWFGDAVHTGGVPTDFFIHLHVPTLESTLDHTVLRQKEKVARGVDTFPEPIALIIYTEFVMRKKRLSFSFLNDIVIQTYVKM